jgi:hypothetical protein
MNALRLAAELLHLADNPGAVGNTIGSVVHGCAGVTNTREVELSVGHFSEIALNW